MLGTTRLVFMANAAPSRADGSVIDHIGYTMGDVPAAVARIVANGGTLLARAGELPGATMARLSAGATPLLSGIEKRGATTRVIFVEGPSGTKIELLQR
jgi:hypothetical protein